MAAEKIALVVGNSQYRSVGKLTNPVNDAADMAVSLGRLGFQVKHLTDLDLNGFRRALIEFGNSARTAESAVIFFAGHGVEIDGKNWLIPIDAEIKSEVDVYAEAINLETLIDISVMPKVIGLVVLDACRNNPFSATTVVAGRALSGDRPDPKAEAPRTALGTDSSKTAPASVAMTDSLSRGLAPVEVTDNVLVAFAAAAGTVANDGTGRNSPYSGALLRHVEKPGLEINYLFRNVHDDVVKETGSQQPVVYGTLSSEEVYLKQGDARVAARAEEEAEAETLAWPFVRVTNDIATLRRFSERFPASRHSAEVRDRVAQLENAEKFAWSIVERQNSVSAYRAFLDLYPYGDRVETARVTLASLEASSGANAADAGSVDLPKPPTSTYQLASAPSDTPARTGSESVEKAWDVLKSSRDQNVVSGFSKNHPSMRRQRLPAGSDLALRPVNATEWMLRTGQDDDVNACFGGTSTACVKAIEKYPDYVQLRFQLCRAAGKPDGCMTDAVEDARERGYLVSTFTRSEKEKARNREYRAAVQRVNQNVGTIVTNVVSNVVGNVVSNAVSNSVSNAAGAASSAAAASAAAAAAASAANAAARIQVQPVIVRPPTAPMPQMVVAPTVLTGSGRWDARLGSVKTNVAVQTNAPVTTTNPGATSVPAMVRPSVPAIGTKVEPGRATPTLPPPVVPPVITTAPPKIDAGKATPALVAPVAPPVTVAPVVRAPTAPNIAPNAGAAASTAAGAAASSAATNAAGKAAGTAATGAASKAASTAAGAAASTAAGAAASGAAGKAASTAAGAAASTAAGAAASGAAGKAASNAAGAAASNAAGAAAGKAASTAASNAAGKAASTAASNAAGKAASAAASNAAGKAASAAASNAASKAAQSAASKAASSAASNAASNIRIPSDIRLKRDIVALTRENGLQLYRYRYIGDHAVYVGVMAQEAAKQVPGAVIRGKDGYLEVDYSRLGLQFLTYEEWTRRYGYDTRS